MADRTQLRAADHNDIADDDPFAELTRIMGFDPRQPVRPQAPAQPKAAVADQPAEEGDFDIDLEKELMGEFGADDSAAAPVIEAREPAFEAAAVSAADDDLAVSLDDDFHLDMADFDDHAAVADHADLGAAETAPSVEAAFGSDFDNAVASSLEDVSPFEDDQPMEDELAASLDQDFQIDDEADEAQHVVAAADMHASVEPAYDPEFDDAVAISLEDELMLDNQSSAEQSHIEADAVAYPLPAQAAVSDTQAISNGDFAGHADDAMADVDMDFDVASDRPVAFDAPETHDLLADEVDAKGESHRPAEASDDAFDLNFDDAFVDTAEEPVAEIAAAAVQPAAPAATVAEPVHAPIADERSLEDELNALLGAMTARTAPVASEAVMVQPAVAAQPAVAVAKSAEESTDLVGDLDWDLDETTPDEPQQPDTAQAAEADLDDLLVDELRGEDLGSDVAGQADVDFDNDAFDAALAKSLDPHDVAASQQDEADSLDWLAERSAPAEPARSWSRVTPVPQQPTFAAQPTASMASVAATPAVAAVPSYRSAEPVEIVAPADPVSVPQARQPARYEEMPDVETVDVPERVVALADDLDIPELHFEEDEPAASGYDDLDAEFASLLTDMNAVDVAAAPAANASSASYDDESYNAGFKPGYDQVKQGYDQVKPGYDQVKPGHEGLKPGYQPEARTYTARPMEMPARAATPMGYADAADGFNLDNLPGSQPVSQAEDFTVDELDYDPELDEAMSVPGLGEREAAKSSRGRGMFIAAIIGAVAVAGGLGAFALSFGGKGGSEAPVIVKADNTPIKVKPENPGGAVVPNQDNKVYDAVAKGAKPTQPVQEKLVTNTEEPVDVQAKDPARAIDLSPGTADDATAATDGADAAGNAVAAAPAPKSEDRIAQVLQDADKGTNADVVAVAPRKVRTMVVKSDGSLVPREDPAPAAPQVAATEPVDPAPQHVAPAAQADADQTGTVAPAAVQADDEPALKPAAKPKAQSANTPAKVPVAPQRPSDQPVDVVGEVKPDQVASIDPSSTATGGGSWSMQIASQPTVESAQSSYQDLQRRYGSVLAGRTANIVKAEIAGKGTFYRVRVPAQSRNDAINLCTSYKAAGGNCFVSR
ncbi:SPOR domain-containing protein [Mesorhizobium qingshengii]|uniref:Sporulation related domain-containing protein n=1 Tax=Mesorhizobium qingshengii TaxID=1165689 RepID=A0A1G5VC97_9HYPH|nr:SPOR domain-containing protein [Mesorhizobium qingshengii]SDA43036.1 Sporulation related domain-containing protein [Mesorhizobium qingshengii]